MDALYFNGTELVALSSGKSPVGCRWVYIVKVGPDGKVDQLKTRLVTSFYGFYALMTLFSVGYKECLPSWGSPRGGLCGATAWFCGSGGV